MDQTTAQRLYEEGAIFIFLGVPEGTEFGIDMKSWDTGEKFRGVKMIPPGIHYIFFSSVSNTGDRAPRIGFYHEFRTTEILVKKWDPLQECISLNSISENEIVGLKDNLRALDGFLGPYPYDIHEKWMSLTTHITGELIKKLTPTIGFVNSALELEPCSDANRPRGSITKNDDPSVSKQPKRSKQSVDDDEFLPKLKAKEGTALRLTEFPERNFPDGSTPAQITQHSLDSSYVLDTILASYSESTDILGELQFCYICFLVGQSLEAFDQWKKLFSLFCSCDVGVKKHRRIFDLFITAIEVQIKEVPEDFLADIVSNNNFVYVKLRQFLRTIRNSELDNQFKNKVIVLKKLLSQLYLWDFSHLDSEDDDEAPVVVEL